MNIFNKITLQSMKKSHTRTLVTIIGVILSTTMITAVATFAVSLQSYMINGSIAKYGGWHVEFLDVDSSFVQERTHEHGVSNISTFENIGYATLNNGKTPNKPYLFIAGFSKKSFDTLPITLISGRLPKNSSEILVPAHVSIKSGVEFSVGNTLTLSVGNRIKGNKNLSQHDPYICRSESAKFKETLVPKADKTYTVVGICQRPDFEEHSAPGYTLITTTDPANQGNSFSTFVTLTNPRQVHAYAINTAKSSAYVFNDNVLRFMGLSDNNIFNSLLYSVGGVLVILIMIGSVFLIYNSFNISLNQRTRQFGILSSIGATAKQLRNSVLFEGLYIGAIGIPIGVIVGIGSIRIVISVVSKNFANILYNTVPLTLRVSTPAIIVATSVSMVTILISAYIPARKAANTPVMESIRQTSEIKLQSKTVKTSKLVERIYGLEGTLALKNFKRNKKCYSSIILSLTLSMVLFVSANAFGTHLKQMTKRSVVDSDYDICFSTQNMDQNKMFRLYNKLKTAHGIYESSYQTIMSYSCAVNASNFSDLYRKYTGYDLQDKSVNLPMDIQFIEDTKYLSFIKGLGLPVKEYIGKNSKIIAVAKAKNMADTQNGNIKLIDMFASGSMNCTIAPEINDKSKMAKRQNINITFVDTIPFDTPPINHSKRKSYTFMVVAPYQLKEKFKTPGAHVNMALTFRSKNPSQSVAEMETIIQGSGITSEYTLYNLHQIIEQNRNILFVVNLFTYVFVIMISLIAIANVFNTISTNIKLRRRELAMLRSVGMSDGEFKKMMNFECAFYGTRTLMLGLPITAIISWLIYKGLIRGGADIDFTFPWVSMGISVCGIFFIVFITMIYCISKIKKENIIDSLRDDMT